MEHEGMVERGRLYPNNVSLKEDLVAPEFTYSLNTGKMLLESKQSMKARKVCSPDLADALALTFSYPVSRGEHKTRGEEHHVHGEEGGHMIMCFPSVSVP